MITFLEFAGAKLSTNQRKNFSPLHKPFNSEGDLRDGEGISDINKIADSRQHDASLIPAVEKIRIGQSSFEIVSHADAKKIMSEYGISNIVPGKSKKLSNMPIALEFDNQKNSFILRRV